MGKFKRRARNVRSFLISRFIFLNGIISIIILGLILAFLIANSIRFFSSYPFLEFLTGQKWSPTALGDFGFLPLLTGSLLVTFGAIVIAVPLGIGSAIYIGELAPRAVREVLKPIIEVLATIPSVVIGFIGIKLLAPLLKNTPQLPVFQDKWQEDLQPLVGHFQVALDGIWVAVQLMVRNGRQPRRVHGNRHRTSLIGP